MFGGLEADAYLLARLQRVNDTKGTYRGAGVKVTSEPVHTNKNFDKSEPA